MPVIDTEVLFALNPRDTKHQHALNLFKEDISLIVPDTAILEFQMVLRGRGTSVADTKLALVALHEALNRNKVREVNTIGTNLLALQCDLEERHHLSFFDSLIAASALTLDHILVSDDEAFGKIPDLTLIPLSKPIQKNEYET